MNRDKRRQINELYACRKEYVDICDRAGLPESGDWLPVLYTEEQYEESGLIVWLIDRLRIRRRWLAAAAVLLVVGALGLGFIGGVFYLALVIGSSLGGY